MSKQTENNWAPQFEAYNQTFKPWLARMDKIVKRYRDERATNDVTGEVNTKKINIYYSNTTHYLRSLTCSMI